MTEQQNETAPATTEEKAPELPKTEPPTDDAPQDKPAETEEAAKAEEPKKSGGVARRFTFNRKWGKARDEQPKEPEPAKDPKEDIIGWIGQQIPGAVHKASHMLLEWVTKIVDEGEETKTTLPGRDGMVTRNQFVNFLKDGQFLTKLANKLQSGAIEPATTEEGADAAKQKEVQKQNIEKFVAWANTQLGREGDNALTLADITEKGKAGFSSLFDTLWQLATRASEKFGKEGLDVDAVVQAANQIVGRNIIQSILNFFRRARPVTATQTTEVKTNGDAQTEEKPATEEVCVKVETPAPAAVAAN